MGSAHLRLGPQVLGPVGDDGLGLLQALFVVEVLLTEPRHLWPAVALQGALLEERERFHSSDKGTFAEHILRFLFSFSNHAPCSPA